MAARIPPIVIRLALVALTLIVVSWMIVSWFHANAIRSEFLLPRPAATGFPFGVEANEAGRIVLERTPDTQREGVWGLVTEQGYGQVSTVVRIDDTTVERGFKTLEGVVNAGDGARIDEMGFPGDPLTALGLGFEDLAIPSDIGPHRAWFVDGRRSTWVVFVHGRGIDRLQESLRVIPTLVEQGFPILVMSYRGDVGATPPVNGMRLWGLDEWRDVEAAVGLAQRKGAADVVLYGSGYGASIVSAYLNTSTTIDAVRGVVYESPVVDLEGVVRRWERDGGVPRPVAWLGRSLATIRFGVEWDLLDQHARADGFDVPLLVIAGAKDPVTPIDEEQAFTDAVGERASFERFEQAAHADAWNVDSERYESTVVEFLVRVIGPE